MIRIGYKEKGFATIALSLGLLLAASIITLYSTQTALAEQRVAHNDYRVKQAFEAADAGLNMGIMHLNNNAASIIVDGDADGYIDPYTHVDISNAALPNNTSYNVAISNATAGDLNVITLVSTGTSMDGEVIRTIRQNYTSDSMLRGAPPAAFTAKGDVSLGGNLMIENQHTDVSVWSGGVTSLSGSADTCNSSVCSSRSTKESDIVESDANLASLNSDEFFGNFFESSKAAVKSGANVYLNNNSDHNYSAELNGVTNKLIWIDQTSGTGRINGNVVIGSPTEPVVLIVTGDFHFNGTADIYGVVYFDNNWHNSGGGNLLIRGSVIVNGDFSGTGTPNIEYDPNILSQTVQNLSFFSKVAGSWRDF